MGNGRLVVYGRGPEILQCFGPPYSSASSIRVALAEPRALEARSEREPGTAVWSHELLIGGASMGRITDFVARARCSSEHGPDETARAGLRTGKARKRWKTAADSRRAERGLRSW
jgi:hypothetical protein